MADLNIFEAGKGINANKLNENFDLCKTDANNNESQLTQIAATALKKDGSNLTQDVVDQFNQTTPNIINAGAILDLEDNSVNFVTLTENCTIQLPTVAPDNISHTISMVVAGGLFSLNLGTAAHLLQNSDVDTTAPYSVMYLYNKLDNKWYYLLTQ